MSTSFPIRYGRLRWLLVVLALGPSFSGVTLADDEVAVRLGWGFRARFPRSDVAGARRDRDMRGGIGAHGWRGRWLVNGAVSGIVTLEIAPTARAWVLGFPVRLRTLHVSLEDPDAFLAALDA